MSDEPRVSSKQPIETYYIEFDFSKNWIDNDTVDLGNSTITAVNSAGQDATSDVLDTNTKAIADSTKGLKIRVKGGAIALSPYAITAVCMTAVGNKWQKVVDLVIY